MDNRKVFGVVKSEFLRISRELRQKMNVIYLFHESKDKENDEIFYSLVCEGSARTLVWQPADLGAHLFIQNGERYLGFTPTAQYSAKSAYGIKGLVKVPELKDGEPNDFLTKLFEKVKTNLSAENIALKPLREAYDKAMLDGQALIDGIDTPENALEVLNKLRTEIIHALTKAKRSLKRRSRQRLKRTDGNTRKKRNPMLQKQNKFLITQSLISAWQWALKLDDGYEDPLLKTLRREPTA